MSYKAPKNLITGDYALDNQEFLQSLYNNSKRFQIASLDDPSMITSYTVHKKKGGLYSANIQSTRIYHGIVKAKLKDISYQMRGLTYKELILMEEFMNKLIEEDEPEPVDKQDEQDEKSD